MKYAKKKKINTGSSDRLPGRPHFPAAIAQTCAFADWMPLKRRVGWGWRGSRRAVLWVGEDGRWRRHFVERPNPLGGSGTQSRYCFCFVPSWGVSAAAVHHVPVILAVAAVPWVSVSRQRWPLSLGFEGTKLSKRSRAAPLIASGSASFLRSSPNSDLGPPLWVACLWLGRCPESPVQRSGGASVPRTPLESACNWISLSERWFGDGDLRTGNLLRRGGTFLRWEGQTECRIQ